MTLKQKRRAILKSVGIGSVWSTPIISSVVLPAHASTTTSIYKEFLSAGTDSFPVPAGVTQLKITVNGAGGGTSNDKYSENDPLVGGDGEQVVQTVSTVPGDTLNITVGGGGYDGWYQKGDSVSDDVGKGGTPGNGGDAESSSLIGGGGGGYSQISGTGISIQAGGGGGGSTHPSTKGGVGGGTNGGAGGIYSDGGHAGNGLGGKGSSTSLTNNDPPLKGEDGSVIISST